MVGGSVGVPATAGQRLPAKAESAAFGPSGPRSGSRRVPSELTVGRAGMQVALDVHRLWSGRASPDGNRRQPSTPDGARNVEEGERAGWRPVARFRGGRRPRRSPRRRSPGPPPREIDFVDSRTQYPPLGEVRFGGGHSGRGPPPGGGPWAGKRVWRSRPARVRTASSPGWEAERRNGPFRRGWSLLPIAAAVAPI